MTNSVDSSLAPFLSFDLSRTARVRVLLGTNPPPYEVSLASLSSAGACDLRRGSDEFAAEVDRSHPVFDPPHISRAQVPVDDDEVSQSARAEVADAFIVEHVRGHRGAGGQRFLGRQPHLGQQADLFEVLLVRAVSGVGANDEM